MSQKLAYVTGGMGRIINISSVNRRRLRHWRRVLGQWRFAHGLMPCLAITVQQKARLERVFFHLECP